MISKFKLGFLLFVLGLSVFVFSVQSAQASDPKNMRSPIFVGVKRVFIHVRYVSNLSEEETPELLRKENIEAFLMKVYGERFSSTECKKRMRGRNPYSCDDQPVTLIKKTNEEYRKEETRKGTLNIMFWVHIYNHPVTDVSTVTVQLIQDRPERHIPTRLGASFPFSFSLDVGEETINRYMNNSIVQRIR